MRYGTLDLTVSSPAQTFEEKLTVQDVKDLCRIEVDTEDSLIEGWIPPARNLAEILQGIDLVPKRYDLYLDQFPCSEIELRRPLQSVELIRYTDSSNTNTDLTDEEYFVDTARGIVTPAYGRTWPSFTPRPSSAVLVQFTSGYASDHPFWSNAGSRILQGMKLLISEWYHKRLPEDIGAADLPSGLRNLLCWGNKKRPR